MIYKLSYKFAQIYICIHVQYTHPSSAVWLLSFTLIAKCWALSSSSFLCLCVFMCLLTYYNTHQLKNVWCCDWQRTWWGVFSRCHISTVSMFSLDREIFFLKKQRMLTECWLGPMLLAIRFLCNWGESLHFFQWVFWVVVALCAWSPIVISMDRIRHIQRVPWTYSMHNQNKTNQSWNIWNTFFSCNQVKFFIFFIFFYFYLRIVKSSSLATFLFKTTVSS